MVATTALDVVVALKTDVSAVGGFLATGFVKIDSCIAVKGRG